VQLLENVSSCCNLNNALVMIEVEEELRVDGQVVLRKGSPGEAVIRFSQQQRSRPQAREKLGPKVELAPVSLTAVDGTRVALREIAMATESDAAYFKQDKGDLKVGGDGGYWVRGPLRASKGTGFLVRTLKTTRVDPGRQISAPPRDATEPTLTAKLKPASLITELVEPNQAVDLVFSEASPESLELYRVNDLFLPHPVTLKLSKETRKKAVYDIYRWNLIRYGDEDKNTLYMRFRHEDGRLDYVKATYRLFFDWQEAKQEPNRKPRRRRLNPTIPGQN